MDSGEGRRTALRERGLARERHDWEQTEPLLRLGRALADPMRLRILSLLAQRSMYGQELAAALDVTPPTISRHLTILRAAGLIRVRRETTYHHYSLDTDGLRGGADLMTADYLLHVPHGIWQAPAPPSATQERDIVQAAFFDGDSLRTLPADPSTWRLVLERVARTFEWGRIYAEPELNSSLKAFHEDVASVRRAMVDNGIMMRERGRYWLLRPHDPRQEAE